MNRTVAVFVALALLLAHTLAIHQDANGSFGPPYDLAYVAYHLARNLVFQGHLAWGLDQPGLDSYPSLLWVLVAAAPERLYVSVNVFCQTIGIVSALLTIMIASQFGARRAAGLITPLLLAVSGGLAAAAANGTETALFTLFAAASFTAMGKGWSKTLSVCLTLACLTRPSGALVLLGLFAVRVKHLLIHDDEERDETGLLPFLAPSLVIVAVWMLRLYLGGRLLSPTSAGVFHLDPARWGLGLASLRDFFVACPAAVLIVYPAWYLLRGNLSGLGRQGLALSVGWFAYVVVRGGGSLPYYEAFVPCLPLLFLAVQEGVTLALDCGVRWVRLLGLGAFALAFFATGLASRIPADLGPLPIGEMQTRWMQASRIEPYGATRPLGRNGLFQEIQDTEKLRSIGLFLRDHENALTGSETLLTPWPGALAYLSGMQVIDLMGRTSPAVSSAGRDPSLRSWHSRRRTDLVEALEAGPDYVVPFLDPPRLPDLRDVATHLIQGWDAWEQTEERVDQVVEALAPYELIAVPLRVHYRGRAPANSTTYYLLRRRDLDLRPRLRIGFDGGTRFHVDAQHRGHKQLAHLRVSVIDADGEVWYMRPNGRYEKLDGIYARTRLLMYATGTHSIRLMEGSLGGLRAGVEPVEIRAQLFIPGARGTGTDNPFAVVSDEAVLRL